MTPEHGSAAARMLESLPLLVRRYAERVVSGVSVTTVRVGQTGEMTLKPSARPRRFTAIEEFADGILEVRALGLPLQRKRGPALGQGEAFRYLAEIAWVPHAILANPQLEWRELDRRSVEVATRVRGERVAVRLMFNEAGEIAQTIAQRPRLEAGNAITPWIGVYDDYQDLGGVRVPRRGEVRWELPEGRFTYWRGTITSLELCS